MAGLPPEAAVGVISGKRSACDPRQTFVPNTPGLANAIEFPILLERNLHIIQVHQERKNFPPTSRVSLNGIFKELSCKV